MRLIRIPERYNWHESSSGDTFQLELSRAELFALRGLAYASGVVTRALMAERARNASTPGMLVHTDGPVSAGAYITVLDDLWRVTNKELRWPKNTIETARPLKSDGPSRTVFNPWD